MSRPPLLLGGKSSDGDGSEIKDGGEGGMVGAVPRSAYNGTSEWSGWKSGHACWLLAALSVRI